MHERQESAEPSHRLHSQEDVELGGYFIVNGIEKVLRLIQVTFSCYDV